MTQKSSLINIDTPKFLENALSEPAKEIGRSIANIFYLVFRPMNLPIEKLRIKQAESLKKYEIEIAEKLQKIPEEHLIEPQLSIVGPALEASKYYINEEEIRSMFAKLISASVDARKSSQVHHSFVEIIKQLSPLDAQNIKSFGNVANHPIVNWISKSDVGQTTIQEHVFLQNTECDDLNLVAISITNLQRLGIVEVNYSVSLNSHSYEKFTQHRDYIEHKKMFEQLDSLPELPEPFQRFFNNRRVEIVKGMIILTPLGSSLKRVCLE